MWPSEHAVWSASLPAASLWKCPVTHVSCHIQPEVVVPVTSGGPAGGKRLLPQQWRIRQPPNAAEIRCRNPAELTLIRFYLHGNGMFRETAPPSEGLKASTQLHLGGPDWPPAPAGFLSPPLQAAMTLLCPPCLFFIQLHMHVFLILPLSISLPHHLSLSLHHSL